MKIYYLLSLGLALLAPWVASAENLPKTSLSGVVTDKSTGELLPGATIYLPDLKTGAVSDLDGAYLIQNLPQARVMVQVSLIGYKTIVRSVDLNATTKQDFALEVAITEINEVVVTGGSQAGEKNRTPTPISTISQRKLLQHISSNIIDAVASLPGVSQVTTGAGISKPVIRGLGYNRVVVVNDGIRQEGQQWGDEHGIEIDEFAVHKVEVLKGPASLSYGSDAMAGVINMLSAPTQPDGGVQGHVLANYQTNNGLIAYSANVEGNLKGFIWDLRYSGKMAHAYQNRYDGYVFNSGFKENTLSGIVGLQKSWGFSHLHFSYYHLQPGIIEGERDSLTGQFIKPVALNDTLADSQIATDKDFRRYASFSPYQQIRHYKAVLNNSFFIGAGNLKATFGFQQNQRQEFADVLHPDQYGLFFLLNTIHYDLRYLFPQKNKLDLSFGVNGMQQDSQNKGAEFLVPEYSLFDFGVFAIAKKSLGRLDLSGGIRFDTRNEQGKDLFLDASGTPVAGPAPGGSHPFSAFESRFAGFSGSMGMTYQITEQVFTKLNLSRGFRAPNIAELGANGEHEGTGRYEIGDPKLPAEGSWQVDASFGMNTEHITAEVDFFRNYISHFIYTRKLNSVLGGDSIVDMSNPIPTFKYAEGNAVLTGGEISFDIHPHPLDWLHFQNAFSIVQSVQQNATDSTRYLPLTPAPKWTSELRADFDKAGAFFRNAYIECSADFYFKQNHFYSAYGTETATPGYTLLSLGAGADIAAKGKTLFSIYFSVSNLLDVAYQSHLSRLKYTPENFATGRTGVYNMGRNISLKVVVPIE